MTNKNSQLFFCSDSAIWLIFFFYQIFFFFLHTLKYSPEMFFLKWSWVEIEMRENLFYLNVHLLDAFVQSDLQ